MKKRVSLILTVLLLLSIVVIPMPSHAASPGSSAGRVALSSGRLNVRAAPSTGGAWLSSLTAGTTVTLLGRSGDWWRVEYAAGRFGYCHADYITPLGGTTATVATGGSSLNVRRGAGTGYARIEGLPDGERVVVLSTSGGWSRILYRGVKLGYVSAIYLRADLAYPAVSLPVPHFRQTDSRWSWRTLGSSGKTIGKVGCATTSIAMMESYRTGTTVTPDVMCRRLTYTASGNVYWPSHYTLVTDYSLDTIYRLLSQGNPVMLGGKTASGGQHWIVVTGYVGGATLTPSGFLINDPGVGSRRTLGEFFSAYPYFYKMFYY